ncbi:MAG: hypothetical protein JRI25_24610 [Deltaproteobacteria bacterium]|nr:hypothetical protein [Deltaproteobacteria bacterium]MBW2257761.1 hypothetical protein [Deltaproteobacteria bacterium]
MEAVRLEVVSHPPRGWVACHACGTEAPLLEMLRDAQGPVCTACELEADSRSRARRVFRKDMLTGVALVLGALTATMVAVLASGLLPLGPGEPTAAFLGLAAAAGLSVVALTWGGWASVTGGDTRLDPGTTRRSLVRASGALTAVTGLGVGLVTVGLVAARLLVG